MALTSELYSSLWQSCDELRGRMDASQYKDYVLVLLFIKYVSDEYRGSRTRRSRSRRARASRTWSPSRARATSATPISSDAWPESSPERYEPTSSAGAALRSASRKMSRCSIRVTLFPPARARAGRRLPTRTADRCERSPRRPSLPRVRRRASRRDRGPPRRPPGSRSPSAAPGPGGASRSRSRAPRTSPREAGARGAPRARTINRPPSSRSGRPPTAIPTSAARLSRSSFRRTARRRARGSACVPGRRRTSC